MQMNGGKFMRRGIFANFLLQAWCKCDIILVDKFTKVIFLVLLRRKCRNIRNFMKNFLAILIKYQTIHIKMVYNNYHGE